MKGVLSWEMWRHLRRLVAHSDGDASEEVWVSLCYKTEVNQRGYSVLRELG